MVKNTYGKLGQFDLSSKRQDWTKYRKQMNFYFSAKKITNDKQKRAIPLEAVGDKAFKFIGKLFGQANLKSDETTADMIIMREKDHLLPKHDHIFCKVGTL